MAAVKQFSAGSGMILRCASNAQETVIPASPTKAVEVPIRALPVERPCGSEHLATPRLSIGLFAVAVRLPCPRALSDHLSGGLGKQRPSLQL